MCDLTDLVLMFKFNEYGIERLKLMQISVFYNAHLTKKVRIFEEECLKFFIDYQCKVCH